MSEYFDGRAEAGQDLVVAVVVGAAVVAALGGAAADHPAGDFRQLELGR